MEKQHFATLAPLAFAACLAVAVSLIPAVAPATPDELAEVAVGYIKAEQPAFAKDTLREALAGDPKNHRANYVAGMLALQEKRYPDAARYLKTALDAQKNDWDASLSLGVTYQSVHDYAAAREAYRQVYEAQPSNAKALYNLGMLEIETLHYHLAKRYLEAYLTLQPNASDRGFVVSKLAELDARIKGH